MITVGADVGKFKTKICWKGGVLSHLSKIATYREIKDTVQLDQNYIIIEYNNKKYLAGELAEREGQNYLNSFEVNKSNLVTLLNLLIGLSKIPSNVFDVVLGNPFGVNTQKEREQLKELIYGVKQFKVNDKEYRITIRNVGVAPEGVAAWYSSLTYEDCNIFDFGSSTIHAIAIRKKKLLDKRSHTFEIGFENMIDNNLEGLMESLKAQMEKKWNDGDKKIILVGGKAPEMFPFVSKYYPKNSPTMHSNYEFANAIGLYQMGVIAFEKSDYITSQS